MITEYELYSDERCQKHKNSRYLLIGGIICTNKGRERLHRKLEEIRSRFSLTQEMRWTKVSRSFLEAYESWVNVFFDDPFARYSILVINLSEPTWRNFQPRKGRKLARDDRLASGFYHFLLVSFGPLRDTKRWWVYPDVGFFSRDSVLDRVEFLFNRTYKKAFGTKTSRIIRLARALNSRDEDLVQLTDVLLGAIGCHILGSIPTSNARCYLVKHCTERMVRQPKTRRKLDKVKSMIWVQPGKFSYPR